MFTEDHSVTSYLSSLKDHLFSLVSTTLKIVIFCFWNKLFSRYCPNQGAGEGGSQLSQNVQTQYVQIRGGGRGVSIFWTMSQNQEFFFKVSLSKQMWTLITWPEVLSSDWPTIYNHAGGWGSKNPFLGQTPEYRPVLDNFKDQSQVLSNFEEGGGGGGPKIVNQDRAWSRNSYYLRLTHLHFFGGFPIMRFLVPPPPTH